MSIIPDVMKIIGDSKRSDIALSFIKSHVINSDLNRKENIIEMLDSVKKSNNRSRICLHYLHEKIMGEKK